MQDYKSIWQQYAKRKPELTLEEYERLQLEIAYLKKQLSTQSKLVTKLKEQAFQDGLTLSWNRRKFQQDLEKMVEYSKRYGRKSGLLLIDLNHFKSINDNLGHLAGDEVLQHICDILKKYNRINDEVYRLGGDEFAILIPKATEESLKTKSEFLSKVVSQSPCLFKDKKIFLSASIGFSIIDKPENRDVVLESADKTMYRLKQEFHSTRARLGV